MGNVLTYKEELIRAMKMLARNNKVIFLGQGVSYENIYGTLEGISKDRKIELPIFEDTQMGLSIGLALEGFIPITIYQRMDFLILAMNQMINHLDKMEEMSDYEFNPKVIIRVAVGSTTPLNPGLQHMQDYTELFKACLTNIDVIKLVEKDQILPAYEKALESNKSTLLIEVRENYDK